MSQSNWLLNIAVRGCLIALLAGSAFSQENKPAETPHESTAAKKSGPTGDLFPIPSAVLGQSEITSAEEYEKACHQPGTRDYADLCQQWRMVQMAVQQVDLIQKQIWLTFGEVALLIATFGTGLWLSMRSDKTSRAQLRAYVMPVGNLICAADHNGKVYEPAQPIGVGYQPVFQINLKNSGQTPAYKVYMTGRADLVDWPFTSADLKILNEKEKGSRDSLGSGDERGVLGNLGKMLTAQDMDDLGIGKKAIVCYGFASYQDVFGKRRSTNFCYFIGGAIRLRGMTMTAHHEGNDAT